MVNIYIMTDAYSNLLYDNSNMLVVYSFILDDCCNITSFMMNIYIMRDVYSNMLHDSSNMLVLYRLYLMIVSTCLVTIQCLCVHYS